VSYHLVHDEAHAAYPLAILREVARDLLIDSLTDPPPKAPLKIAAVPIAWQPHGGTPYGRKVLSSLVERVASSEFPGRNEFLNRMAFLAGGYVASGQIDRDLTIRALITAARACGLEMAEAVSTVARALRKGMERPIYPPA
jgi:hypothetical protein